MRGMRQWLATLTKKIREQNLGGTSEDQYKRRTCGLSNVAKRDIRIRCDLAG